MLIKGVIRLSRLIVSTRMAKKQNTKPMPITVIIRESVNIFTPCNPPRCHTGKGVYAAVFP